jgi:hypothetical protein
LSCLRAHLARRGSAAGRPLVRIRRPLKRNEADPVGAGLGVLQVGLLPGPSPARPS